MHIEAKGVIKPTSVSFSYIVGWDGEVVVLVLDGTQ